MQRPSRVGARKLRRPVRGANSDSPREPTKIRASDFCVRPSE